MASHVAPDYCSWTKAIEHVGDRWSLLIVRELGFRGPRGFNDLVTGLPGRISRSVLTERLHRLLDLGLVARDQVGSGHTSYRLTRAGADLMPTLLSLRSWADSWLPDDPAMVQREPAVVLAWLARRVETPALPERPVVLEIVPASDRRHRLWLVLQRDTEPYGCLTDPLLEPDRYIRLRTGLATLLALARGDVDWGRSLREGVVTADGDPLLVGEMGAWLRPVERA